eukprot:gb/GFBE01025732.1/.p1 GENE.gb/GFBE01025732.1/~~gb/GFBE01025732.1/.p1  ORF type:complete len:375 (+),score=54.88 gb/GFBE01025732.1/:1-1125(+)
MVSCHVMLATLVLAAGGADAVSSSDQNAFLLDDECMQSTGDEACGLSALQRRAEQHVQDIDWAWDLDDLDAPTQPDLKEYQNFSLPDLGSDELRRLIDAAHEELADRGIAVEELGASADGCHTALPGEQCFRAAKWAKDEGVRQHPNWYPGLTATSSLEDFQAQLHAKGRGSCPKPCGSDSPRLSGVITGNSGHAKASSNSQSSCGNHVFSGGPQSALCFCQLAGNPGCAGQPCACPQGCGGNVVWRSVQTVTFKNRARADGCHPSTVLLTVPKAYFGTPADLKHCGGGALQVIELLLVDSWNMYQTYVGTGSMHQCFHGSRTASVKYLHLQSFCSGASFHAMPSSNPAIGTCVTMHSLGEAKSLAQQLYSRMQ